MQRQAKFKTYDMAVGTQNAKLKVIARNVLNSDVPIRYKIGLRDDILAMKEKERLGFNFNRSLAASLRSRWDVVENATKSFLQEIVDMNDQIEEDSKKNERQIMGLIFTRSTNLGLESRVEQMGGLYMRVNFYKSVLEEKIKQLEPCKSFLSQCCELMGYLQPGQLLDRYAALNHVFKELYREYDDRISMMNKLQERLSDIKSETDHRHMLMHNEMSELHMSLKALTTRITYMEFELHERMDQCTGSEMELYNIKNSIHRSYVSLMLYRGLEPTDTDPFEQLEHIATRIKTTQEVIRMIREENQRRDVSLRRFRREKDGDQPAQASESVSSLDTVDDNENRYDNALTQDANSNLWLDSVSWVRPTHGNPVGASDRSKYGCGLPPLMNSTRGLTGRKKSTRGSRLSHLLSQRRDMRKQYGAAICGPSQKKMNPSPSVSPRKNVQNVSSPFRHLPEILEQVNETLRKANINFSHPDQVGATYKVAGGNHVPRYGRVRADDTTRRSRAITKGEMLEDKESGPKLSKFKCLPDASAENEVKQNHNFNKLQTMAKDREADLLPKKAVTTYFQTESKTDNAINASQRIRRTSSRNLVVKEMGVNEPAPCKSRPSDGKRCETVPKKEGKETNSNQKVAGKIPADLLRLCTRRRLKTCADTTKKMEPSRDAAGAHKAEPPWLCRRQKLHNYLEILNRFPAGAQQTITPD